MVLAQIGGKGWVVAGNLNGGEVPSGFEAFVEDPELGFAPKNKTRVPYRERNCVDSPAPIVLYWRPA